MIQRVIVPDVGATGSSVAVSEWLAQEGEFVSAGQPLFVLETDKAVQTIEAFAQGYLRRIVAPPGMELNTGDLVALITDTPDEPLDESPAPGGDSAPRRKSPKRRPPPAKSSEEHATVRQHSSAPAREAALAAADDIPLGVEQLREMYRRMVLIRRYEDHLYRLFLQGQVPGTLHQCQGQEGVAVGVCMALRNDDVIFSTHRPVGHLLAKGASLRAISAEIWGKATGCAGGKGGQMHLQDPSVGAMPSNAIVGANIPIAAGAALGFKLRGLDRVAVSFFGDGAANIGAFHEGINLAAVKAAPAVFVCENNLYAASTHISLASRVVDIAERAAAYGIPGQVVDGMDVTAVHRAAAAAVVRARSGAGPTLLECKTYRYPGHSRGDPGNYRQQAELEAWRRRDPLLHCRRLLCEDHGQSADQIGRIEQECQDQIEQAVQFARESPDPPAGDVAKCVYAERSARR